ncbi:MAG: hypothetical protein AB7K24_15915 [Gemmataceae bacterium]
MTRQRLSLAGLLLAATLLVTGCSFLQVPFFLMKGEPKIDPLLMPLAQKGATKVVILTSAPVHLNPEFLRVDHDLTSKLVMHLNRLAKENKEKLTIVPTRKVDKFKDDHPDWASSMDLAEIGEKFEADYVIYVEIESISMYEKGTGSFMYRGRAGMRVEVVDVNDPDAEAVSTILAPEYPPSERGAVPSDEARPAEFRQKFLDHLARKLAYLFTAHTTHEEYRLD